MELAKQASLEQQMATLQAKLQDATAEKLTGMASLQTQHQQNKILQEEISQYQQEVEHYRGTVATLQAELQETTAKNKASVETELAKQASLQQQVESELATQASLQQQVESELAKQASLEQQVTTLNLQLEEAAALKEALQSEGAQKLLLQQEEVGKLQQAVLRLETQLEQVSSERSKGLAELQLERTHNAALSEELDKLQGESAQSTVLQREVSRLRAELQDGEGVDQRAEMKMQALRREVEMLQTLNSTLKSENSTIRRLADALQGQLDKKEQEHEGQHAQAGPAFLPVSEEEVRFGDPGETLRRASTLPGQLQASLDSHRLSLMAPKRPAPLPMQHDPDTPEAKRQSCFQRPLTPKNRNTATKFSNSPAKSPADRRQSMMFCISNTPKKMGGLMSRLKKGRKSPAPAAATKSTPRRSPRSGKATNKKIML